MNRGLGQGVKPQHTGKYKLLNWSYRICLLVPSRGLGPGELSFTPLTITTTPKGEGGWKQNSVTARSTVQVIKHWSTSFLVPFCDSFRDFDFAFASWAALPLKTFLSWDQHTLSFLSYFTHSYLCNGLPPSHRPSSLISSQSTTISKAEEGKVKQEKSLPPYIHTYKLHCPTQLSQHQCSR